MFDILGLFFLAAMIRSHLFTREFWRTYWIALRRSRRDDRDRKTALIQTLWLIGFSAYVGTYFWFFLRSFLDSTTRFELLFGVLILVLALGVRALFLRGDERVARAESAIAVNIALLERFKKDALLLSVLISRQGSEQYIQHKELPPGFKPGTRQAHLAFAQTHGLLEAASASIRELLFMADGCWPKDAINLWQASETLRCLRWVLRLDNTLMLLSHLPRVDHRLAQELVDKPRRLLKQQGHQDIWDIRIQRVAADPLLQRTFAELIARNLIADMDAETHTWARTVSDQARQVDYRDLLVSHYQVSELDESGLRYLASIAFNRQQALSLVMQLIDNPEERAVQAEWQAQCDPSTWTAETFSAQESVTS